LDVIGETGVEDAEAIAESLAGLAPSSPQAPADETARRLAELDHFFADQSDVLEYFVPEAIEHLEAMAHSLVALEGEGSTESEIAALFRAVHTLKGAAYTVGCGMIGDLAHRVEDMLGEIREQQRPLDRAAIETVFAGLDALRLLVRSGEDRADTRAAAYERAMALLDALPAIGPVASSPSAEDVAAETAEAPATASAAVPSPPAVAETPPPLEPVVAAESVVPAAEHAAPAAERAARGDRSRSSRDAVARRVRPSIRVSLDRLDALMNLVGELVITRSRLERHLTQLEQAGELLSFTQSRMTQTVAEFESKYANRALLPDEVAGYGAPALSAASAGPLADVFAELEFDRYDDFNLLARRVGEISSDLTEIQLQLAGLVRVVREDAGGVQRLSGELRGQITRASLVPIGRLFARFARQVREGARAAGKTVVLEVRGETVE